MTFALSRDCSHCLYELTEYSLNHTMSVFDRVMSTQAFVVKPFHFCLAAVFISLDSCWSAEDVQRDFAESQVRMAVQRAVPLIEKAASGSADQRRCFTCHSQAIPVLALTKAQKLGFDVDSENLERQVRHTFAHLQRGKQKYEDGTGQGGRVVTAGYALWTLEVAGHPPDDVTSAVAGFLLQDQKDRDHWQHASKRPPTAGSPFMTSYVAIRGLTSFGTTAQQEQIRQRRSAVSSWLLDSAQPQDTEDHVFCLRLLTILKSPELRLSEAAGNLLALQRSDGGWAQCPGQESDAYATATVVSSLLLTRLQVRDSDRIQDAIGFLLQDQRDDGSWFVRTRAKGFQEYFESGFPHGEHQFISTSATAWSMLALLQFLNNGILQSGAGLPADCIDAF